MGIEPAAAAPAPASAPKAEEKAEAAPAPAPAPAAAQGSAADTTAAAFMDPSFVNQLLSGLPGVDPNDPKIKDALASIADGSANKKDEDKKDEDKKGEKK